MTETIRSSVLRRAGQLLLCGLLVLHGADAMAAPGSRAVPKPRSVQGGKTPAVEARYSAVPRASSRAGAESVRRLPSGARTPAGEKPEETATTRAVAVNGEWLLMPIVIPEAR